MMRKTNAIHHHIHAAFYLCLLMGLMLPLNSRADIQPVEAPEQQTAEETAPADREVNAFFGDESPETATEAGDAEKLEAQEQDADLIARQEEIRRQAREIEARRRFVEARQAAGRGEYRQSLDLYDAGLQRLPVRPETEKLRSSVQQERLDTLYQMLLEQVRTGTREEVIEARNKAREALRDAPDHRRLQRLVDRAERNIEALQPPPPPRPYESGEVQERRRRVHEMLEEARGYLRTLDLKRAQELFEAVLSIEPENPAAKRYLRELHNQRYLLSSLEREATTREMIADVRSTWRPREYEDVDPVDPEVDPRVPVHEEIIRKMEEIIIPEIQFRQANIHDVVDFLVRTSIDEDPEPDPAKRGVNIILNLGAAIPGRSPDRRIPDDPFAGITERRPAARPGDDITVTFTARYITLKQALEIITQVAGLKYHIEGNVVMIVPKDAIIDRIIHRMYPVEPSLLDVVEQDRAAAPRRDDPFRRLDAEPIERDRAPVQQFFEQMGVEFPPGSSIAYRPAIGKLVVANTAENLEIFERILREVDIVPSQVEIEARFVEVNQTDLEEFGLQWLLDDNWQMLQRQGQENLPLSARQRIEMQSNRGRGGFTRGLRFASPIVDDGAASDFPYGGGDPVGGGSGTYGSLMTVSSILTNPEFSLVINALAQQGHADLLSAPKITTRAGQEANIRVVVEYIYPTDYDIREIMGEIDGSAVVLDAFTIPTRFEMREVGVILSVLPEVSPDGRTINLTLRPEVTDEPTWRNYGAIIRRPDGSQQETIMEQPFFPTRTLTTQISIYDGATVVMGGLITENLLSVDDKIPLLGDLPLLGRLFRSSYKRSAKRNLLIFVTARLVDPAGRHIRELRAEEITPETAGQL